ncbi:MAG: FtsQ-type POTRA domain-containing protein [Fibrobacteria bacterium]|nr:FtsQ-type POTRA domain-containing protein [Fibrobacteria bacterium]
MNYYSLNNRLNPKKLKKKGKVNACVKKSKGSRIIFSRLVTKSTVVLKLVLGVGLVTVCIGAAAAGFYRYYQDNSFFILREIVCEGNHHLTREDILVNLKLELGTNLFDLALDSQETRLMKHRWVEEVSIKRRYPSTLLVIIKEKAPLAISYIKTGKKAYNWKGISDNGQWLPGVELYTGDLPVVETLPKKSEGTLPLLGAFLKTAREDFPGIYHTISQVKCVGGNNIAIYSSDNYFKFMVSLEEDPEETLELWRLLLNQHCGHFQKGHTIDLRVPGYAYVS